MAKDKRRIAQNRAKKQARKVARKKQRQPQGGGAGRFAHWGCTRAELERSPVHAAYVADTILAQGIGDVIIARNLPDGRIATSHFLIDAYCLGVKDAFITVKSPREFSTLISRSSASSQLAEVTAPYARKLIEDAIAYARDLGFEPHRDFREAAVILGDIDSGECSETFTFGHEGKPLYISGPGDSESFARRIVRQLTHGDGPGGHYIVRVDESSMDEFEDDEEEDDYDPLPPMTHEGGEM